MPRPRRSREQWCDLVTEWRDSGWSGVDFARNRGLNPNTFAWWRSELSRSARPTPLTLVPVKAMPKGVAEHHPSVEVVIQVTRRHQAGMVGLEGR